MHRVAITGVGVVSPLGSSFAAVSAALQAGRGAIAPIENIAPNTIRMTAAAQADDRQLTHSFAAGDMTLLDRLTRFTIAAGRDAMAMSGLALTEERASRGAVIWGTGVGSAETVEENYRRLYRDGGQTAHPLTVPRAMMNAAVSHLTIEHKMRGPSFAIASACASSNHAIGVAFEMVRSGAVDVALTGGGEACLTVGCLKGWDALRVVSPDTCRPFSKGRLGLILGEGSAVFVLERWDHAVARGADILVEMIGSGMSSDSSHIVRPTVEGPAAAMKACLASARLTPEDVDYVNAHGTGTLANDITETAAIHRVFGDAARRLAVSSTKSLHGHLLGGSGALELVATMAAVRDSFAPPTINFMEEDPDCDLDYVPNEARQQRIDIALSNSFAFGGHNAVIAIGNPARASAAE